MSTDGQHRPQAQQVLSARRTTNLQLHALPARERICAEAPSLVNGSEPQLRATWSIILAGGDGKRLRPVTRLMAGDERPKQFCRVLGESTLLDQTRRRSALAAHPDSTYIVLKRADEPYFGPQLTNVPPERLVVQPQDRGTAIAILLALLRLPPAARMSPVVIIPSDHYVSDDAALMTHVIAAAAAVRQNPSLLILLGITPDGPENGYGWIGVGDPVCRTRSHVVYGVAGFWEKPSTSLARELLGRGCLWNSFIMVGTVSGFLEMFRTRWPRYYDALLKIESRAEQGRGGVAALSYIYSRLPSVDFSRHLLSGSHANLAVLPVAGVLWNDLGEPHRLWATLWRIGASRRWPASVSIDPAAPEVSRCVAP